jgi:hypothetical protein
VIGYQGHLWLADRATAGAKAPISGRARNIPAAWSAKLEVQADKLTVELNAKHVVQPLCIDQGCRGRAHCSLKGCK